VAAPVALPSASARGPSVRVAVWVLHMALPVVGLWLLLARPRLDLRWEHHGAHLWLVAAGAAVNLGLGAAVSEAARRRGDARLFLVSLAFLSSAGFLLMHALATPGVLLDTPNRGFVIATPVGLLVGGLFAAASAVDFTEEGSARLMRRQAVFRGAVAVALVAWAAVSLLGLAPLDTPLPPEEARGPLVAVAVVGSAAYLWAALRYHLAYRSRPSVMLVAVLTSFVLLAEAMLAAALGRNWQASWWLWHVLMVIGFAFVAYSAHVQYRREGSTTALFQGISLAATLAEIRKEYGTALESLVATMRRRAETGDDPDFGPALARVGARFELSEGQTEVLGRAASALAAERDQIERLGALVEVGNEASVIADEAALLERAVGVVGRSLGSDGLAVGLVEDGALRFPPALAVRADLHAATTLALPLQVKGHGAGVVLVGRRRGGFPERDRAVLDSLANQLSIALENARLYRQIDGLFRQYLSPTVVTALLADPEQAALGGAVLEATVLFADLRGFTSFSERASPEEVVDLLNRYYAVAVPAVIGEGGTLLKFVGDALMAVFNVPVRQADHVRRGARAGLAMQAAVAEVAAGTEGLPVFRVGVHTGPVLVGNIGSAELRDYTVIGDTVNLASRLQAEAPAGGVVIGESTLRALPGASVRSLGEVAVKGKRGPVQAYLLENPGQPA
jgi:class 3 adenylate cyclase